MLLRRSCGQGLLYQVKRGRLHLAQFNIARGFRRQGCVFMAHDLERMASDFKKGELRTKYEGFRHHFPEASKFLFPETQFVYCNLRFCNLCTSVLQVFLTQRSVIL